MKVFFGQGYFGPARGQLPGEEIKINKTLDWAGENWLIPSVYACGQGLVVDLCRPVAWARMQAFMDKWHIDTDSDERHFAPAQLRQIEKEHPLDNCMRLKMQVNGRALQAAGSSGFGFMMDLSDGDPDAEEMLSHYALDRGCAWAFMRYSFRWATTRKPRIREMTATFVHDLEEMDGAQFTAAPGQSVDITHPVTGQTHTLRVLGTERVFAAENVAACLLKYTTQPELSRREMTLRDTGEGVGHKRMRGAVGIIGSGAVSSLYDVNDWPEAITWQAVFHVKTTEDAQLQLI